MQKMHQMARAEHTTPTIKIRVFDTDKGETSTVNTDLNALPDNPQYNDDLRGIIDAIVTYYASNSTVSRIEIEISNDD
jgi:hypothetical protein